MSEESQGIHELCSIAQVSPKPLAQARRGAQMVLSLEMVDRLLVKAGMLPTVLHALYPIERLHDDGTGNFVGGWDGEPGAVVELVLPRPASHYGEIQSGWSSKHEDWVPPEDMFEPSHRERLLRMRREFKREADGGERWRRARENRWKSR